MPGTQRRVRETVVRSPNGPFVDSWLHDGVPRRQNTQVQKMTVRRLFVAAGATVALMFGMLFGTVVGGAAPAHADTPPPVHEVSYRCGQGYYENSNGGCTRSPGNSPSGIRCKDGTYSYAKTRQGACSHHGGIDDSAGTSNSGNGSGSDAATGSAVFGSAALGALTFGSLAIGLFGS